MNRKLHRTVIALSATVSVFTVLLLAGAPVQSPALPQTLMVSDEMTIELPNDANVQTQVLRSASQRRHLRHSRALLALPYFSFAQGLRRNRS